VCLCVCAHKASGSFRTVPYGVCVCVRARVRAVCTGTEVTKEGEVLVGSEKGMKHFQFLERRKCLQPPLVLTVRSLVKFVSNFRREQDLLLIHSKREKVKVRNFSGEQDLLLIHSTKKKSW
jgi:hypothetical protein